MALKSLRVHEQYGERKIMMNKRMISIALALMMALSCVTALGENARHERVFAVLGEDGTVRSLTDSIHLENPEKLEVLTDSTLLTGIENAGGGETFTLDGEKLTWQAGGKEITYQGTSDKPLPVTPVVTASLDGQELPVSQLKDKSGEVTLTVSYLQAETLPHLAASVILLPETGIRDLTVENGTVLSLSGKQAVLGWAVPGADAALQLPAGFTLHFQGDHADLGWMMTFASADPVQKAWQEMDGRMDFDPKTELGDAVTLLTALQKGESLPEVTGKAKELPEQINSLNNGLQELNGGASKLAEGAAALDAGLATLSANSEKLNSGAEAIFAAVLNTVNQQLAASGLADAGIEAPALTADNYEDILTTLIARLDSEAVTAAAREQVEAAVRAQVEANEEQIRGAVTEAARAKVLGQVLTGAGLDMDAETYLEAVKAGQVKEAVQQQVQAAVDAQMETEPVQTLIAKETAAQVEQLVADNVDKVMASDENVTAKLAQAQSAHDALQGALDQLKEVSGFVTGVKSYTAGVDQAAAGASELSAGAATLHDSGTDPLRKAITGAEKAAAEKLLEMLNGPVSTALDAYDELGAQAQSAGYDLRSEDWETTTVYIMRTDFNE